MRFSLLSVGCLALALSGAAQAQYANSQAQGSATKGVTTKGQKMVVQKTTQTATTVTPLPVGAFLVGGSDDCSTAQAQNSISGTGTFSVDTVIDALRGDCWARRRGLDWQDGEQRRLRAATRRAFYPDTDSWRELVLVRTRQCIRQAVAGAAGTP